MKILFYSTFLCILSTSYSQVGNSCKLPITNKSGVCTLVAQCPAAVIQSQRGIPPKICGRQNNVPIVCCEGKPLPKPTENTIGLRKSQKKCRDYSKLVTATDYFLPLSAKPVLVRSETANCSYNDAPLIFGGEEAGIGEFPHMALLGYSDPVVWLCGGSLISERFVLTAAHCLSNRDFGSVKVVRLGELNINDEKPDLIREDFTVQLTYKHPNYNRPKVFNDIALLRLSRNVEFNINIRPACLWVEPELNDTTTIATGWGVTEKDPNQISNALLKVGLNIIDNDKCNDSYMDYFDTRKLTHIDPTMICARNTTHSGDTCFGDSGGPIQVKNPENKCIMYIIGVTSVGRSCGGNTPGIYTRVSSYIDWIEKTVWS